MRRRCPPHRRLCKRYDARLQVRAGFSRSHPVEDAFYFWKLPLRSKLPSGRLAIDSLQRRRSPSRMNWKLIGSLSLLGILLGIASYWGKPGARDIWICAIYALVCAVVLVRIAPEKRLSHGFLLGLVVGALIYAAMVRSMAPYGPGGSATIDTASARTLAPFILLGGGLAQVLLTWLAAIFVGERP